MIGQNLKTLTAALVLLEAAEGILENENDETLTDLPRQLAPITDRLEHRVNELADARLAEAIEAAHAGEGYR